MDNNLEVGVGVEEIALNPKWTIRNKALSARRDYFTTSPTSPSTNLVIKTTSKVRK